ncbi:MAG: hypothetical protein WCP70_13150 [Methanothrix sp.]
MENIRSDKWEADRADGDGREAAQRARPTCGRANEHSRDRAARECGREI